MLISVVYRPPNSDNDLSLLETSIGSLNLSKYGKVIIVGDFNVDLTDSNSTPASELLALMSGFGLYQMISEATRITPVSSTHIDLLFCNDPQLLDDIHVSTELGSSDHCSLSCNVLIHRPTSTVYRRKVWLYQKANFDALNAALEDSLPHKTVLDGGDVD